MSRNININSTETGNVDVNVNVNVKKEIAGIYTMIGKRKDYMPEFRAFAVALAKNIGKKEAAAELGLKDSQVAHWIGDEQYAKQIEKLKKERDADCVRKRSEKLKTLQEENDKLRQYISNNIIASILQNEIPKMKLTLDTDTKPCYIFYTATFPK